MSKDYISREAAIWEADEEIKRRVTVGRYAAESIKRRIEAIPAADVKPVVRGRWKRDSRRNIICSVCGDKPFFSNSKYLNYCPNCGASMEVEHDQS